LRTKSRKAKTPAATTTARRKRRMKALSDMRFSDS